MHLLLDELLQPLLLQQLLLQQQHIGRQHVDWLHVWQRVGQRRAVQHRAVQRLARRRHGVRAAWHRATYADVTCLRGSEPSSARTERHLLSRGRILRTAASGSQWRSRGERGQGCCSSKESVGRRFKGASRCHQSRWGRWWW